VIEVRQTERFASWLAGLRDREARLRIVARIERIASGLLGDSKPVGGVVSEARIAHGPGYRLYFVQRGATLIVLLCGGDKSSQTRDIALAKRMAGELEE
jgi:putative addiction module killer protein